MLRIQGLPVWIDSVMHTHTHTERINGKRLGKRQPIKGCRPARSHGSGACGMHTRLRVVTYAPRRTGERSRGGVLCDVTCLRQNELVKPP